MNVISYSFTYLTILENLLRFCGPVSNATQTTSENPNDGI